MTSARDVITTATTQLAAAGIESARVDAELLLAGVLGVPRGEATRREALPASSVTTYQHWVERRANREPLQHIVGEAAFRYVVVAVGPGVFVPRPETELLIDAVLPHLRAQADPVAVDLCAGSGVLAAALADEVPGIRVAAVERSAGALRWLARNVPPDVQVIAGDVADPELLRPLYGRVDAVVSNPPYVPAGTQVAPEVHADPAEAVFAGEYGLAVIPAVIARARLLLKENGILAMEHDETHESDVHTLLTDGGGWDEVRGHRDLTGRPRYVTARRAAASSAL